MNDFRSQKFDERVERVAARVQAAGGMAAVEAAARATNMDALVAPGGAAWVAPAPSASMANHLGEDFGWSMSEEDQRMLSAGFRPNDPDDCQRWEAQKRGVAPAAKFVTLITPGQTEPRDALKKVIADGIERGVAAVLRKLGIEPPPEPVVEGADAPLNEDK